MNLEKLLAENMLRFGAKNLDSKSIRTLKQLIEQAAATTDPNAIPKSIEELADSADVKQSPVYNDVIGRLIELAKKDKPLARRSLQYWRGVTDASNQNFIKNTDVIINTFDIVKRKFDESGFRGKNISVSVNYAKLEPVFQQLVDLLKTNKSKNVYVDVEKQLPSLLNLCRQISRNDRYKFVGGNDPQNPFTLIILPGNIQEMQKFISNFSAQVKDKTGKTTEKIAKVAIASITDADKIDLLKAAQIQLEKRKEDKKLSLGIKGVDKIIIAPATEFSTVIRTEKEADAKNPIIQAVTYPDISKGNTTESQNFFGDNQSQLTAEQKSKIAETLQIAVNALKSEGVTLTEIQYNAGASTSKVYTRYTGPGTLAKVSSAANNEILVKDRIASIETALREAIDTNPDTKALQIVKQQSDAKPNQGAEYGKDANGAFGPNGIRWKFDAEGKLDPSQKAEYEKIYAPYRSNFGAFVLVGMPKPPEEPEAEYSGQGKWRISLIWNRIEIPPPPQGGGRVVLYPMSTKKPVPCPIF
jgi:hypothetical protein